MNFHDVPDKISDPFAEFFPAHVHFHRILALNPLSHAMRPLF
jgi:hypothetical protein